MSDWELMQEADHPQLSASEWEVMPESANSQQQQNNESLGASLMKAPFRVGEDIYNGAVGLAKKIPEYYQSIKNQSVGIPGLLDMATKNPHGFMQQQQNRAPHALGQLLAGGAEMFQDVANIPPAIAQYSANRLNLLPKSLANRMPTVDFSGEIQQAYGEPKYPGEELMRSIVKNLPQAGGALKILKTFNPLRLTANSITKDILSTEEKQITAHTKLYNNLWDEAKATGFNNVPVDKKVLSKYLKPIEKYKTPKEYQSLKNLIENPTLQNAQKTQSDMGIISRALADKSRKSSLTSEEKALFDSAVDAENYIENNMFKNEEGTLSKSLKKKYDALTKSYKKNVVPYKYNPDIQAYKNEEISKQELVKALSKGEFAVKRGKYHPSIQARKRLLPAGGGGLGLYELDKYLNKDSE